MRITRHSELEVFKRSYEAAMVLFRHSKTFPKEEAYALTDQMRRSSRSVCANLSEAWRKRRYEAAFVSKLSDAETEAGETQTWLEFAVSCGYLDHHAGVELNATYEEIIRMIVAMINHPGQWTIGRR